MKVTLKVNFTKEFVNDIVQGALKYDDPLTYVQVNTENDNLSVLYATAGRNTACLKVKGHSTVIEINSMRRATKAALDGLLRLGFYEKKFVDPYGDGNPSDVDELIYSLRKADVVFYHTQADTIKWWQSVESQAEINPQAAALVDADRLLKAWVEKQPEIGSSAAALVSWYRLNEGVSIDDFIPMCRKWCDDEGYIEQCRAYLEWELTAPPGSKAFYPELKGATKAQKLVSWWDSIKSSPLHASKVHTTIIQSEAESILKDDKLNIVDYVDVSLVLTAWLCVKKEYVAAINICENAIMKADFSDYRHSNYYLLVARTMHVYTCIGQSGKVISLLQRPLSEFGFEEAYVSATLAKAYIEAGDTTKAIELLKHALWVCYSDYENLYVPYSTLLCNTENTLEKLLDQKLV